MTILIDVNKHGLKVLFDVMLIGSLKYVVFVFFKKCF